MSSSVPRPDASQKPSYLQQLEDKAQVAYKNNDVDGFKKAVNEAKDIVVQGHDATQQRHLRNLLQSTLLDDTQGQSPSATQDQKEIYSFLSNVIKEIPETTNQNSAAIGGITPSAHRIAPQTQASVSPKSTAGTLGATHLT